MTDSVPVRVVIVTFNSEDVVAGCLSSLEEGMAGVADWDALVVDNASTDATAEVVRTAAPGVEVLTMSGNAGYAAAINAAADHSDPDEALLIVNPDVRLARGCGRALLDGLAAHGVGIVVPRIVDGNGDLDHSLRRDPSILRALGEAVLGGRRASRRPVLGEVIGDDHSYAKDRDVDWASGAIMLVGPACRRAVGPWDESFFLYSEETDYCQRARDAGFSIRYTPRAGAVHLGGESGTAPELWALLTRNRVRLYARRHGVVATAAFRGAVLLNEALRSRSPVHRAAIAALLGRKARLAKPDQSAMESRQREQAPGYVCFSAQDWWYHNRAHSDFQLMRRVAESRTVLFVNSIGMRMPMPGRSTKVLRRLLRKARSITKLLRRPVPELPRFWVMTPFVVPFYGNETARRINAALVRAQVRLASRRLGIDEPVYVVTIPTAWEVVADLPRRGLVYNRSDKHSAFTETDQDLIRSLEGQLLRHADHVLYVSHALMDDERTLTGDRGYFLDHGVDLAHFRPRPAADEPADLAAIPHPRVGFFGGFDDYVIDFDLIQRTAQELPDAQVVLIGDATCSMKRFDALPNVHWLGFRPYEDIPRYGSGFDVAIMPWLDNDWIRSCNPIKLKEYLALDLPVVSTDYPEVHAYTRYVDVADSADEFVALVRKRLDSGPDVESRAAVEEASWDRRAAQLIELCEPARGEA